MMNLNRIKTHSKQVYNILLRYTRCTFGQLQKLCNLANTDLCFALVQLLKENKIEQVNEGHGVYYRPVTATA